MPTAGPPTSLIESGMDIDRNPAAPPDAGINLGQFAAPLGRKWPVLLAVALLGGVAAYSASFLIAPTFTSRASFITPQQQQNSAAAALASLGALSGLGGAAGAIRSPADQYIALMQSETLSDRIIERFKLTEVYERQFRVDTRRDLNGNVRMSAGKKDNIIAVEVDDRDPARAAEIANTYVKELKTLLNGLALTEAQQRRAFFEQQLGKAKESLATAQLNLQKTGFNAGALKNEPKAAAESYAQTKAALAATEVRLGALRRTLTDSAPEVQQQQAAAAGLREQLARLERPLESTGNQDYISAFREFKYHETLFDIFARQFELAKLDEAREGALIQQLDVATPAERKSKPKRSIFALIGAGVGLVAAATLVLLRARRRG